MSHLNEFKLKKKKKAVAKQNSYPGQVLPVGNKFNVNPQNLFTIPNGNETMESKVPLKQRKKKKVADTDPCVFMILWVWDKNQKTNNQNHRNNRQILKDSCLTHVILFKPHGNAMKRASSLFCC